MQTNWSQIGNKSIKISIEITNFSSKAACNDDTTMAAFHHMWKNTFGQRDRCNCIEFNHITIHSKIGVDDPCTLSATGIVDENINLQHK